MKKERGKRYRNEENKIICSYYSRKYRFIRMVTGGRYLISEKPCGYLFLRQ